MANKKRKSSTKAGAAPQGADDATKATSFGAPNATDPILVAGDLSPAPAAGPVILAPGKPVTTSAPQLDVAGFTQPGTYVFELVVEDDLGEVSQPASINVQVSTP